MHITWLHEGNADDPPSLNTYLSFFRSACWIQAFLFGSLDIQILWAGMH